MNVSRRTLIQGGAAGLGIMGLGGLAACSTAAPTAPNTGAATGLVVIGPRMVASELDTALSCRAT